MRASLRFVSPRVQENKTRSVICPLKDLADINTASVESYVRVLVFASGVPLAFCVPWALQMEEEMGSSTCWEGYVNSPWLWLIIAPRLTAVTVSCPHYLNAQVKLSATRVSWQQLQ